MARINARFRVPADVLLPPAGKAKARGKAKRVATNPGFRSAQSGLRLLEWVVTGLPYVIVYETDETDDEIVVLGIYHGAQIRPGQ